MAEPLFLVTVVYEVRARDAAEAALIAPVNGVLVNTQAERAEPCEACGGQGEVLPKGADVTVPCPRCA